MPNMESATIKVNSDVLSEVQLEEKRKKVKRWQDYGYGIMAISYFLSLESKTLSTICEENNFIINLE